MAIQVKVDEHDTQEVPRETGMTVGNAVDRAYRDKGIALRPMSGQSDDITLNGRPARYDTVLKPEHTNAKIRVDTDAWQVERASQQED